MNGVGCGPRIRSDSIPGSCCRARRARKTPGGTTDDDQRREHGQGTCRDAGERSTSHPDCWNKHESGAECTGGCSSAVRRVQQSAAPPGLAGPREPAHRDREGGAERQRRYEHQRQARRQPDRREQESRRSVPVGPDKQRRQTRQLIWHGDRDHTDRHFKCNVGVERFGWRQPRRDPARENRPGGEPAHERGDDGARRREAVAHVQREQPRPAHLVDEARQPGAHVGGEKQRSRAHPANVVLRWIPWRYESGLAQ